MYWSEQLQGILPIVRKIKSEVQADVLGLSGPCDQSRSVITSYRSSASSEGALRLFLRGGHGKATGPSKLHACFVMIKTT